jgi:hypothetical protein
VVSPRAQVIENFGLYFESYGLARIVGRVYGALMIADEPVLGLDALTEQLGISKASASTAARQLHGFKLVEKVSLPGDRRDYYRVSPDAHISYMKLSIGSTLGFAKLIEAAAHIGDLSPPAKEKLERIEHLYEGFAAHIEAFFAGYTFEAKPTDAARDQSSTQSSARKPTQKGRPRP